MTPEQRHYAMSRIRSTENRPEREIRSKLHGYGFRFRKNDRRLAGSPDIVLPRYRAVIVVNGCFWHAHRLICQQVPPAPHQHGVLAEQAGAQQAAGPGDSGAAAGGGLEGGGGVGMLHHRAAAGRQDCQRGGVAGLVAGGGSGGALRGGVRSPPKIVETTVVLHHRF